MIVPASDVPRMFVVAAAEQLAEFRPRVERGQRHVRGDEPFALVFDERRQIGALLRVERDVAMAEKEDRVHVRQARTTAGRRAGRHQRLFGDDVRDRCGCRCRRRRTRSPRRSITRERVRGRVVLRDAVARVGPGQHRLCAVRTRAGPPRPPRPPCPRPPARWLRAAALRQRERDESSSPAPPRESCRRRRRRPRTDGRPSRGTSSARLCAHAGELGLPQLPAGA